MRTTERYIKVDPRHLADAKAAIEEYMVALNRLTDRNLLAPELDTSNLLPSANFQITCRVTEKWELPLQGLHLRVVGAPGIEPGTPTMSKLPFVAQMAGIADFPKQS